MRVRAIDENNDWTFGRGLQDYKENDRAVSQNIKTRLQSFYRDCFFDLDAGLDWFNLLGRGTKNLLLLAVKMVISQTEGVFGINNVDVQYDEYSRHITITYDIKTIYSQSYQEIAVI